MKLNKIFFIIIFICISINTTYTYAKTNITLETIDEININEEFNLDINIYGNDVYALTLNILYDSSKVEFIGDNDNVEVYENKLIYMWYDESGGTNPKKDENVVSLKFKAIGSGEINFGLNGEVYNLEGEISDINYIGTSINIKNIENIDGQSLELENSNSVLLKELRINYEGMSPDFNKNIENYYFVTEEDIDNIIVEAVPENINANVNIKGNENIQKGINKIEIEVYYKDNKKTYTIYVTKTDNIELANANLENLAIDSYFLNPEFNANTTNYDVEIANDIEKLNILAIPQNINASVSIIGNENLKEGKNNIKIIVTAQDKLTKKEYLLNIYKRNIREEMEYENQQEIQVERLSELLEENVENNTENSEIIENEDENINRQENNRFFIIIISFIVLLIIVVLSVIKIRGM